MASEATYSVGGGDPLFSTGSHLDCEAFLAQIHDDVNMEDWPWADDESAGHIPPDLQPSLNIEDYSVDRLLLVDEPAGHMPPDSQSAGDTSWLPVLNSVGFAGPTAATGVENLPGFGYPETGGPGPGMAEPEIPRSGSALLGFNIQEPAPVVVNAGLVMPEPEPEPEPYSAGDSSSADLEFSAGAHLLMEGLSSRWSPPPPKYSWLIGTKSTDTEIIDKLGHLQSTTPCGEEINRKLGEDDQNCPMAQGRYVTTARMMPNKKTHHGYWKEKHVKTVRGDKPAASTFPLLFHDGSFNAGLKRTFRFHKHNGTATNWFMHEYIPTNHWASHLFMENVRFRVVYQDPPVPGEPLEKKLKNKIAAAKKPRMRGADNLVIKGGSPVWEHFIKVYDRHPELQGSKVVYAVCCHCNVVLHASPQNGTSNLLKHCNRDCPVKNKKQQPSSSSSNSTGDTSCTSTATDTGSSSLDQDSNVEAGLPQSGGGGDTLAKTPVRASCKRKKLAPGSFSQSSAPPEFNLVESEAGLIQSDPSSTESTDIEIIRLLKREESSMPRRKEVNLSLGEQGQICPKAVQSCITTVKMMPDQNPPDLGYWKEKQVKPLREDGPNGICCGLKRTFQFHMNDHTETNWFMHEYIPIYYSGLHLFMKSLRFRKVNCEVPEVKKKNKIAAGKKRRTWGPENLVIKRESEAWQHFTRIYDRDPELKGSKVVYALCCHCKRVLTAENGTSNLLNHCNICPVKNDKQQPSSSSLDCNQHASGSSTSFVAVT